MKTGDAPVGADVQALRHEQSRARRRIRELDLLLRRRHPLRRHHLVPFPSRRRLPRRLQAPRLRPRHRPQRLHRLPLPAHSRHRLHPRRRWGNLPVHLTEHKSALNAFVVN